MSKVVAIMSMSLDGFVADTSPARQPSLANPTVIPGVGITHLRYPVRKA